MKYNKLPSSGPDKLLTFINTIIVKEPISVPDSLAMGLKKEEFYKHSKNQ